MTESAAALCPGYRHVEQFGDDSQYEDEEGEVVEEVEYVTLDLGAIEPTLLPSSTACRIIGLDTPTPFLQLAGSIFKGKHQTLLGTELLFADSQEGPSDNGKRELVHVANTEKRVGFKEVELKEKGTAVETRDESSQGGAGTSKKRKEPQTLDQLAGSAEAAESAARGRGGRRGRGASKGKGRQPEDTVARVANAEQRSVNDPDAMDTSVD